MEWLKLFKGLFKTKLKNIIQLKATSHVETKKDSDNTTSSVALTINGSVNIINVTPNSNGLVDDKTLEQLKSVILPAFENNKVLVLQEESQELLKSYKEFRESSTTTELLDFFRGKISQLDVRLLETGLYEEYLISTNQIEKAQKVKSDVISQYGQRGKNIINLASGGYYKTHIKPLYEALDEQGLANDFAGEYEQIVDELPFAIFVHSGINEESALNMLYDKAYKNVQYGVREETIILNGFGANADRVEKLIPTLQKKYKRIAPKVNYLGQLKSIQVAVYYRETR